MNTWRSSKLLWGALALLVIASVLVSVSSTEYCRAAGDGKGEVNVPKRVSIGAAPPGGTFYMAASALSTVIGTRFPGVDVSVQVTGGSKHNVQLIEDGQIEFGLTSSDVAYEALHGIGQFEGHPHTKVRALMPAYTSPFLMVTLKKKPIYSVRDLKGKVFDLGPKGSAVNIFGLRVLDALGMSKEVRVTNLSATDATRALAEGRIDALILGHPASAVQELALSHPVRVISLNEEDMKLFTKKYPQYPILTLPKQSYAGQDEDVQLPGASLFYICHKDLPEGFVYSLAEAMYQNKNAIESIIPLVAKMYGPEWVDKLTLPLHPGSVQYFKGIGTRIPDHLIPPEVKK